jgi:predicted AAA+ superfamily ATPase
VEEDINGVDGIKRDQKKMLALINSLARNISTPTKISSLQNDIFYNDDNINISKPTLLDYLNVLSKLNIYIEIEAWSPLVRSSIRLRTTTKKILCDTSLAISSLGISEIGLVKDLMTFGHLFERLVLKDLMVNSEANNGKI